MHLSILYIEDMVSDQDLFMRLLRVAGAARGIEIQMDAVATLAEIGAGPLYDCLLLDLSLANGGRQSSLNWIAAHHDHMPPIVVLSGWGDSDEDCIQRGAEDFCHKADAIAAPEAFVIRLKLDILRHRLRRGKA